MIIEIFYIIIFIVIFYIYYYYTYIKHSNEDIKKLINYNFNTGDIILFTYKSKFQYLNRHFTRDKYNHIGIIIDGSKRNMIHISKPHKNINNPIIQKIDMNFLLNDNIMYITILPIIKPIDNTIIMNAYKKILHLKYNNNKLVFVDAINNIIPIIKFSDDKNNSVICNEFIALILHDIGIIKNLRTRTYKFNFKDFVNLPSYDKEKMKTFLIPSYNFNFGPTYLYTKILELIPIPKFIRNK